jgi:hypothetical protein
VQCSVEQSSQRPERTRDEMTKFCSTDVVKIVHRSHSLGSVVETTAVAAAGTPLHFMWCTVKSVR